MVWCGKLSLQMKQVSAVSIVIQSASITGEGDKTLVTSKNMNHQRLYGTSVLWVCVNEREGVCMCESGDMLMFAFRYLDLMFLSLHTFLPISRRLSL